MLYLLLWTADRLMRPTFRNLTDSFESWAFRSGLSSQLRSLEARLLIERRPDSGAADAIYRLTESGRLHALGGRDPVACWSRRWDGRWRIVLFDLPESKASARKQLRRLLRSNDFGCLQKSVWIRPHPLGDLLQLLSAQSGEVGALLTLEARPASGETDADVVAGAWNFHQINRHYEKCLRVLSRLPMARPDNDSSARELFRWAQLERQAWREALDADPLLPDELLPDGYLGKEVWRERVRVLTAAAALIE